MVFPEYRPRRMRQNAAFRAMIRETRLDAAQLVLPVFVMPGKGKRDRYSYNEILPARQTLMSKMREYQDIDSKKRTAVQNMIANLPFAILGNGEQWDVEVTARGGGIAGQMGAVRLGVSRALVENDPAVKSPLKKEGLMTRDARAVERKKFGRKKARKRFQFSKR